MNNLHKTLTEAYLQAADFTKDESLPDFDWSSGAYAIASTIVSFFILRAGAYIDGAIHHAQEKEPGYNLEQVGHDIYFSSNGHGVGFWEHEGGYMLHLQAIADILPSVDVYSSGESLELELS